jgi:endonuclease-3
MPAGLAAVRSASLAVQPTAGRFTAVARPRGAKLRAGEVLHRLSVVFPGSAEDLCALSHKNAYELLAATILSAQCTDERVNSVTPSLFVRYPTPGDLAAANPEELESIIRSTGFFHAKAQSLMGMAQGVQERFGGEVPSTMEELVTLPGVGRKTANVLLSVAFGLPGLPVDTHVGRLSKRLGLSTEDDPVKVERDLCSYLDPADWGAMSLRLILHGRATCKARTPDCGHCLLAELCPSAAVFGVSSTAEKRRDAARKAVGVKTRVRSATAEKSN